MHSIHIQRRVLRLISYLTIYISIGYSTVAGQKPAGRGGRRHAAHMLGRGMQEWALQQSSYRGVCEQA